jgi:hypothetical protein
MLMKLTPAVNFINVLRTAFTLADPKRVKNTDEITAILILSGSTSVKALHKTLMKLLPEALTQACQTRGPRAACVSIACLMQPAMTFYISVRLKSTIMFINLL